MATKKVKEEVKEVKKTSLRKPRVKKVKPVVVVKEEVKEEEVLPQVENATYETTKIISEHKESVEEKATETKELVVESVSLFTRVKLFVKKLFKK